MSVSVSINTSHISYGKTYTVDYECTYTPFRVYLSIRVNGSSTWRLKDLAENLVSTYGSLDFSLTPEEIAQDMTNQGYPPATNTVTGIQVNVVPEDIEEVLNGNYAETDFISIDQPYTKCKGPSWCSLDEELSREAVTLSWGAGSAGTNNSVTGYDVQRRESTDGSSWGSWADVPGSPVTGTSLSVSPPDTVGNYYQYRVRTRGSAGSDYYSGWVTSTNTLRRKWNAFGAWTDQALTAGVSSIRAVHMTQLQERIAVIRSFYGLSAYSFTAVTARQTKIAQWAALIGELRSAIDGITTNHAAWNTLEAGKPRIAHITQLRDIIDNM